MDKIITIKINDHYIDFTVRDAVHAILGITAFLFLFSALWIITPA